MSTNALITVMHEDGKSDTVYLHSDGYPSHAGVMLKKHYNTYEKAVELVALGSLSTLYENVGTLCPDSHSFETPVKGYTVAYIRDRGESVENNVAERCEDMAALQRYSSMQYHYVFANGKWSMLGDVIMQLESK